MHEIKIGSLFSGIGGFCRAFESEGCEVVWANDIDKYVAITFKYNFNSRFILKDVRELSVFEDKLEPVDILTAGFPCQPFSIAGNRNGFNDPRGKLFFEIPRIINEFKKDKPKIILLENVKNFNKKEYIDIVTDELNVAGYWFDERYKVLLNTYKVTHLPQNRERLFMIALNKDFFDNIPPNFPADNQPIKKKPFEFFDTKNKAEEYYYFKKNSKYWKLFHDEMKKYGKNSNKYIFLLRRWYVRTYFNGYTPTLTANMGMGGHNVPVIKDKWGIRKLTIMECARLQGFDESWFKIPPNISKTQLYKQLGNAVSIPVAQKLAKICINLLSKL